MKFLSKSYSRKILCIPKGEGTICRVLIKRGDQPCSRVDQNQSQGSNPLGRATGKKSNLPPQLSRSSNFIYETSFF